MEDQEYVILAEIAKELGLKRTSLYYYVEQLKIQTKKFPLNKNSYVTHEDAERIKAVKLHPWTLESPQGAKPEET